MSADVETDDGVRFNGRVMKWAREWRGRTLEEAAEKLKKKPEDIDEWERGEKSPTVRQARLLADYYDRPFLEFLWQEIPTVQEPALAPDYRLHVDAPDPGGNRDLIRIQGWIETQRLNALDLYEALGERPPELPDALSATINEQAEQVAARVRTAIDFPIETQLELSSSERIQLPQILRRKLENAGILTLKVSDLAKHGARGLALYSNPLPVVAFSTEAPSAQAFTLGHETGHISLGQSAISGAMSSEGGAPEVRRVEEWCNQFAAAFLIPADALMALYAKPNQPVADMERGVIRDLANRFSISEHAMTIRLMHLGYVSEDFYWKKMHAVFRKEEKAFKSFGRAKYYGARFVSSHGELYTRLVLDAWDAGHLTNHNAAEFMDTKSVQHCEGSASSRPG